MSSRGNSFVESVENFFCNGVTNVNICIPFSNVHTFNDFLFTIQLSVVKLPATRTVAKYLVTWGQSKLYQYKVSDILN